MSTVATIEPTIFNSIWHRMRCWIGLDAHYEATEISNNIYDATYGHNMIRTLQQPSCANQSKLSQPICNRKFERLTFFYDCSFINFIVFSRRDTPIENVEVRSSPAACASDEFDSPPSSNLIIRSDEPPPLTRGKHFLKTESDDEPTPAKTKTYNLRRFNEGAHKASSPGKCDAKNSRKRAAKTTEITEDESPTKRSKSTSTPTKSPNRSLDTAYKQSETTQGTTRPSNATCSNQKTYTDLKYLESIGSIRTIRRVKHPGINKVPSVKTDAVTPFISPESQNGWDRKTKLKLSYRLNTSGIDDIQFALIIYEPLTMVTRRNLLEEFEKAARDEPKHPPSTNKIKSSTKLKIGSKPKNDKLASLRRLRFWIEAIKRKFKFSSQILLLSNTARSILRCCVLEIKNFL